MKTISPYPKERSMLDTGYPYPNEQSMFDEGLGKYKGSKQKDMGIPGVDL